MHFARGTSAACSPSVVRHGQRTLTSMLLTSMAACRLATLPHTLSQSCRQIAAWSPCTHAQPWLALPGRRSPSPARSEHTPQQRPVAAALL